MQFYDHNDDSGDIEIKFDMSLTKFLIQFTIYPVDGGMFEQIQCWIDDKGLLVNQYDLSKALKPEFFDWVRHHAGSYLGTRILNGLNNSIHKFNKSRKDAECRIDLKTIPVEWHMSRQDALLMKLTFG